MVIMKLSLVFTLFFAQCFSEYLQWRHLSRAGEVAGGDECSRLQISYPCSRHDHSMVHLNSSIAALFGGFSYDNYKGYNDVWLYFVEEEKWKFLYGGFDNLGSYESIGVFSASANPIVRGSAAMGSVDETSFFIYGGAYSHASCRLNDLWVFDIGLRNWKLLYGTRNCAVGPNFAGESSPSKKFKTGNPGSRNGASGHYNPSKNEYLIFFGDYNGGQFFDSVWAFSESQESGHQWKWVSGENNFNMAAHWVATYGASGKPAARAFHNSWWHNSNEIMIYGGYGVEFDGGDRGRLGDFWMFDAYDYEWKYVGGTQTRDSEEFIASDENKYNYHISNLPKGRLKGCAIQINDDEIIIFGGSDYSHYSSFNDLWIYSVKRSLFRYVSGSSDENIVGNWGVDGSYSSDAIPGSRWGASIALKNEKEILLFYGKKCSAESCDDDTLADVWTFQYSPDCQTGYKFVEGECVLEDTTCELTCGNNAECSYSSEKSVWECVCFDGYKGSPYTTGCVFDDDDDDDDSYDFSRADVILAIVGSSIGGVLCIVLLGVVVSLFFVFAFSMLMTTGSKEDGFTLGDIEDDFTISNGTLVPGSNSGMGEKSTGRSRKGSNSRNGSFSGIGFTRKVNSRSKRFSQRRSTEDMKLGEVHIIDYSKVKLIQEIGSGGSGAKIYKAEWEGRNCAFKVFKLFKEACLGDFERELKFVTTLSHPNIIQFYGVCLKDPRIGLVMEYAEKGDLVSYITSTNHERLSVEKKFTILQDIAMGMNYMHGRNIMHRDLKSPNVLLNAILQAKIIDFGLSKIKEADTRLQTKRVGTCHYMAPEVALGEDYDFKCDVFSFGIMIYEILLENFDPYDSLNRKFIVEFRVANNPNFRPKITPEFEDCIKTEKSSNKFVIELMKKCWSHKSVDRPSFEEISEIFKKRK